MHDMRNGICALCEHPEVLDAPAFEFRDEGDEPIRLAVAHAPDSLDFLGSKTSSEKPRGLLRMLVCRKCGYLQWFASKPEKIPFEENGIKLISPK